MLRLSVRLFFLSFLLNAAACRDQQTDELPPVFNIDPEFAVDLFEQSDPANGSATFGLWVESMADCDCSNCTVVAESEVIGHDISVRLLGIQKADSCKGAPAPAKSFIRIAPSLPDGAYHFSLSLRTVLTNEGTLTVANGHYNLWMPDLQGIEIQNYVLDKIPEGLLWGYAETPDEPTLASAKNFVSGLKKISSDSGLSPGFYSYFTISGTGAVAFHKSVQTQQQAEPFVRQLEAPPQDLKNLLQSYRDPAQPTPLQIRCWTTKGVF